MIESSRRHGYFDPRYPQRRDLDLDAVADEIRLAIAIWEGEGGHASTADELSEPLDWTALSALRSRLGAVTTSRRSSHTLTTAQR
jgi:hypothetical protein